MADRSRGWWRRVRTIGAVLLLLALGAAAIAAALLSGATPTACTVEGALTWLYCQRAPGGSLIGGPARARG